MPPLIFVDSREHLPSEAVATINLSAKKNSVWLIKPASRVADKGLDKMVTVVDPRDIGGAAHLIRQFRSLYVHLSTNPVAYERGCFERFLLLGLWTAESDVSAVWHFDTDAWASRDLRKLVPPGFPYDMIAGIPAGLDGSFPSVTVSQAYITGDVLRAFADFLLQDFFSQRRRDLEVWFARRRERSELGGVSDMMAWGTFLSANPQLSVRNSFSCSVSGRLIIDTLYQLPEQLHAQGYSVSGRSLVLAPSEDGLSIRVGATRVEVAGVHLAGADKPLIFRLAKGRDVAYMGVNQRYVRARHRIRRRVNRWLG